MNRKKGANPQASSVKTDKSLLSTVKPYGNNSTTAAAASSSKNAVAQSNQLPKNVTPKQFPPKERQRPRIKPTKQKPQISEDPLEKEVNQHLVDCEEGEELKVLSRILQPNSDYLYDIYLRIHSDISESMGKSEYNFTIKPFGSTVSGLAFKGN